MVLIPTNVIVKCAFALHFRKHVSCSGEFMPEGLSGACGSRVGQTLYVFAGHCKEFGHSYNVSIKGCLKVQHFPP